MSLFTLPRVALVGRPNVGKSRLFNRLIGRREAIVEDMPGVTRDRRYGECEWEDRRFTVIDTGGLDPYDDSELRRGMGGQTLLAIDEAQLVLFVVDAREGVSPVDLEVYRLLTRQHPRVLVVANKVDGPKQDDLIYDAYELGVDQVIPVSAEHGRGTGQLLDTVLELLPEAPTEEELAALQSEDEEGELIPRIALIGRPNVGKSSMANRLIGEERLVAHDAPGTTRDAIDVDFEYGGHPYTLIDTAGIRRRRAVKQAAEKFSISQAFRAMDRCHVALFLLDATQDISDQDARVAGYAHERDRAVIIIVNKWDRVAPSGAAGRKARNNFEKELRYRLKYLHHAPVVFTSAINGDGVRQMMKVAQRVLGQLNKRVGTGEVNRYLERILEEHSPPVYRGRRLRFYYASQVAVRPPRFVLACNHPDAVHFSYRRYIQNRLRELGGFDDVPVVVSFRKRQRGQRLGEPAP